MAKSSSVFEYKGFYTEVSFDEQTEKLRGRIEGIKDYVDFESDSFEKVEDDFQRAVDDYLLFLKQVEGERKSE